MWLAAGHYLVTEIRVGDDDRRAMALLDTGMTGVDCAVTRAIAGHAATAPDPAGDVAGHGGGGAVEAQVVRLSRVGLGGLVRTGARAAVLARLALSWQLGFQVGGLIASDFFRDAALTLDFERMVLSV